MNLVNSFMLAISGGLIVASILIAKIGFGRSVLSRKTATIMSGVGVGIGIVIFIYYGVSNHNLGESVLTGIIIAITVGFATFIRNKQK
ncbi:MAG: hypothetical protein ABI904_03780 [Chloroflexota bacterium]